LKWTALLRGLFVAAATLTFLGCLLAILITGPVVIRAPELEIDVRPSVDRLRNNVERLCTEFTPRSYRHTENLDRAAAWIEEEFRAAGLEVMTQDYELREGRYRNVIAVRRGVEERDSVMVIGAHYDAYGDFPGADDNASGLAVLLELARTLPADPPRRTQYLVAFSTEEPPFFGSDDMGSYRFAKSLREEGRRVVIMVALDLVGRFSDEPASQRMPFPGLGLLYPDRGNFIAVVGDLRSGSAIKRVRSGMLATGALPVRSFRAPAAMPGVHWSDHSSFRRFDMPSVLVTDTAYLRNPDYHTRDDTPDKLDYERMAKLVSALHGVLLGAR
jgi:hypothetical protein